MASEAPHAASTSTLDYTAFPHIFDAVRDALPHEGLVALRGVAQPLRIEVDAQLADHLLAVADKDVWLAKGGEQEVERRRKAAEDAEAEGEGEWVDESDDDEAAERIAAKAPNPFPTNDFQLYTVASAPAPAESEYGCAALARRMPSQYLRSIQRYGAPGAYSPELSERDRALANVRVLDVLGSPALYRIAHLLPALEVLRLIPHPDWDAWLGLPRTAIAQDADSADPAAPGRAARPLAAGTVVLFTRPCGPGGLQVSVPMKTLGASRLVVNVGPPRKVPVGGEYVFPPETPSRMFAHGSDECAAEEIDYIFAPDGWTDEWLPDAEEDEGVLGILFTAIEKGHQRHRLVGLEAVPAKYLDLEDFEEHRLKLCKSDPRRYLFMLLGVITHAMSRPESVHVEWVAEQGLDFLDLCGLVNLRFMLITHDEYREQVGEQAYRDYTAAYDWL